MERAMPDLKTTAEPQVNSTAPSISMKKKAPGLSFRRFFTKPGVSPYNEVEWDLRLAQITDTQGNVIFEHQNVEFGVTGYTKPQCSACFINSVKDSLDSILTLAKTEGMLFKWGSGTGTNLSTLRSSTETLSGGGTASGPLSFMKGFDAFAGVIKSGGKTRRAAKMVILNVDHPDIEDFIECKAKEEAKAWALINQGYDGSTPDSDAYSSIFFQNANNSVRVNDEFMQAVERDSEYSTRAVTDGRVMQTFKARDLL